MNPKQITAVLVTRGDVDLTPVLDTLFPRFHNVIVYNNSLLLDFKVFSRFIAAQERATGTSYVYVQDDDCIVDLDNYPWNVVGSLGADKILCNMPEKYRPNYTGRVQLLGFGSVFHSILVSQTFKRYEAIYNYDGIALLECDRIFTGLNTCIRTDVKIEHLPWAEDGTRLYRQVDHGSRRSEAEGRINVILRHEEECRAGATSRTLPV